MDRSAIVDMEVVGSDDDSDYGEKFETSSGQVNRAAYLSKLDNTQRSDKSESDDVTGHMTKGVATYVWQEGRQRASRAFNLYANIDILRPYFDVEPHEVRNRLISSLVPKIPNIQSPQSKVPRELYGPSMLVMTLIAMLLMQMKTSNVSFQEGTLMGTAFGVCFGYWFGISGLLWLAGYISNTKLAILQILHVMGYGLFGHCIVIFLTTVFHPNHSHMFFYVAWLVFGGLSTLKVVSILMARTPGRTQQLILCAIVVVIHLGFLIYLHFAYHKIVEDISEAFDPKPVNLPQNIPDEKQNEIEIIQHVTEKLKSLGEAVLKSTGDDHRAMKPQIQKKMANAMLGEITMIPNKIV